MPYRTAHILRRLPVLALCLLLLSPGAAAVRLSECQGNFEAIRGPAYSFSLQSERDVLPAAQLGDIEASANAIYQHWAALIAAPVPFVVDVRLALFSGLADFEQRKMALAPELPDVTGFYAWDERLAVALTHPTRPEQTRRRALHEISHLITVSQLGGAPHWLAEGLAEVHEMVVVTADGPEFQVNERHRSWLTATDQQALAELFLAQPEAWYASDSQRLYALSWSLVYFLLQSTEGRGALGFTLQQASTHSCGSYDASAFLIRAYPGGGSALARDWARWLRTV
ncbi:hypothetical protein EY643_09360 [Halioglobus maricola]|uniref:Peptidase MA-like domain-containing protein n=1 Tax=Halioglobus maricola TaxID=2601894 RepID=A0A5P9NJ42_9GAMM|nr:hypothetical protein [Halioglobus maricola]QFU75850.1 hypothetical protein EY643_09360 [Halioglobus maricola]